MFSQPKSRGKDMERLRAEAVDGVSGGRTESMNVLWTTYPPCVRVAGTSATISKDKGSSAQNTGLYSE